MNIFDHMCRNFKGASADDSTDAPKAPEQATSKSLDSLGSGSAEDTRPKHHAQETSTTSESENSDTEAAPEPAAEPDAEFEDLIKPLTIDDVRELCMAEPSAVLDANDNYVALGVNDMRYQVSLSEHNVWLLVKTNLVIPAEQTPFTDTNPSDPEEMDAQLHLMIEATNRWNNTHYQPTAYVSRNSNTWVIQLDTAYFVGEGMTPSQFYSSLARALKYAESAASAIPSFIPPV